MNEPGNCGELMAVVYELTKRTRNCLPIGHNYNTKNFLCPIRSQDSLDHLEMVRWESVPRGSSTCAWKLSSGLFSRPDWLPLGLRGCCGPRLFFSLLRFWSTKQVAEEFFLAYQDQLKVFWPRINHSLNHNSYSFIQRNQTIQSVFTK